MKNEPKTALFAGGCFWCVENDLQKIPDVIDVVSGYSKDGRESIQVTYDPKKTTYEELVRHFFKSIDPYDAGGQFYDRGHAYTTAIYAQNEEEKEVASQVKKEIEEMSGRKVATVIEGKTVFRGADEHHQNFAEKNPEYYIGYRKGSGREDYFKDKK